MEANEYENKLAIKNEMALNETTRLKFYIVSKERLLIVRNKTIR